MTEMGRGRDAVGSRDVRRDLEEGGGVLKIPSQHLDDQHNFGSRLESGPGRIHTRLGSGAAVRSRAFSPKRRMGLGVRLYGRSMASSPRGSGISVIESGLL